MLRAPSIAGPTMASYEPDPRYLKDLGDKREVDAAFSERSEVPKGQFWNVDNRIRGRWAGAGAFVGFVFAFFDPLSLQSLIAADSRFVTSVTCAATYILGGLVIGMLAASIRRRFTCED
jgi:hypothetical protein